MNRVQGAEKISGVIYHLASRAHISRELQALYTSRTLTRFGLATLGVFMPIFFYTHFDHSISAVLALYTAIYGSYALLVPLSVRLLRVWGTRTMMLLALGAVSANLVALYFYDMYPDIAVLIYIATATLYQLLYWVPYHVDFAESLSPAMRGRQLALLRNIAGVAIVVTPVIGGFLITAVGFSAAFLFALVLILLSMVPLIHTQNIRERYSWGYWETYRHLLARANRPLVLANMANGAQGVALTIVWPVFIFTLLDERYTALGIIVALSLLVTIILRATIGKLFDTWSEKKVVVVSVILATTGWVAKIFVQTPLQVFVADSYHNAGNIARALAFDAATYEQAADNGRFVDEYTTLKEMALNIGRVLMLVGMGSLIVAYDMRIAFAIAAVLSLVMVVVTQSGRVR